MAATIIYGLLIFLFLLGICGLFFFNEYIKKISALSISYSSFLVLTTVLALKNSHQNEAISIMVSLLVVFAVNLLIGIGIVKNIARAAKKKGSELDPETSSG